MKKEYEALSLDVVKFEAQDVITVSNPNLDDGLPGKGEVPAPEESSPAES